MLRAYNFLQGHFNTMFQVVVGELSTVVEFESDQRQLSGSLTREIERICTKPIPIQFTYLIMRPVQSAPSRDSAMKPKWLLLASEG